MVKTWSDFCVGHTSHSSILVTLSHFYILVTRSHFNILVTWSNPSNFWTKSFLWPGQILSNCCPGQIIWVCDLVNSHPSILVTRYQPSMLVTRSLPSNVVTGSNPSRVALSDLQETKPGSRKYCHILIYYSGEGRWGGGRNLPLGHIALVPEDNINNINQIFTK